MTQKEDKKRRSFFKITLTEYHIACIFSHANNLHSKRRILFLLEGRFSFFKPCGRCRLAFSHGMFYALPTLADGWVCLASTGSRFLLPVFFFYIAFRYFSQRNINRIINSMNRCRPRPIEPLLPPAHFWSPGLLPHRPPPTQPTLFWPLRGFLDPPFQLIPIRIK